MPLSNPAITSVDPLLRLLPDILEHDESAAHLAKLDSVALDRLHAKALGLHQRAIDEARDLLDIALKLLEQPLSTEQQRRLIERADDELASAQRWNGLAANARFCREHPELALQLAGNPPPDDGALDRAAATTSEPTPRRARRGARKPE